MSAAGVLWSFVLDYRSCLLNSVLRALWAGDLAQPWLIDDSHRNGIHMAVGLNTFYGGQRAIVNAFSSYAVDFDREEGWRNQRDTGLNTVLQEG